MSSDIQNANRYILPDPSLNALLLSRTAPLSSPNNNYYYHYYDIV